MVRAPPEMLLLIPPIDDAATIGFVAHLVDIAAQMWRPLVRMAPPPDHSSMCLLPDLGILDPPVMTAMFF